MPPHSPVVNIRQWRETDALEVWEVLKDASFSNLYPSFKIAISRHLSIRIGFAILLTMWALYRSLTVMTISIIVYVCIFYMFSYLGTLYYLYGPTRSDMKHAHLNYFRDEDHSFWVAEVDGEIAGTIGVVKKLPVTDSAKVAWLRRMAVKRKFRGLGIAKRLVNTVVCFCKQKQYSKIELITTEVHGPARNLYTQLGFIMRDYKPYKYLAGLLSVWTYEFEYQLM